MNNTGPKIDESLAFDNSMLKVLMVEFLRDSKLPYSMVSNRKFKSIIGYLRPDITVPTYAELLKLNIDEFQRFSQWEKQQSRMGDCNLNNERVAMADTYMKLALADSFPPPNIYQNVPEPTHQVFPRDLPQTPSEFHTEQKPSTINSEVIKEEPITDFCEEKPTNLMIQSSSETTPDSSSNPTSSTAHQCESSQWYERNMENDTEDVKPDVNALKMSLISSQEEQKSAESSNGGKMKKTVKASEKYLVFEDLPGIVKWPCLVCHQRLESSKVRSVNNHDAYIMLFVCVMNNVFPIEKAKEIARMQKLKCCTVHLIELHDSALQLLGVVDPEIDVHTENEKIIDAYHVVKSIRDSRYLQKLVFEGSRKHIIPFCTNLKTFFGKYGRHNYFRQQQASE